MGDVGRQPQELTGAPPVSESLPLHSSAMPSHLPTASGTIASEQCSREAGTPKISDREMPAAPAVMEETVGNMHAARPVQINTEGVFMQDAIRSNSTQQYHSWEETTLTFLASTLTVIILAILFRRLLLVTGTDLWAML